MTRAAVDAWVTALLARHTANLTRPEFLKAIRALSARYVEQRDQLERRSPLDSAGKRAAFAAFYAPLHFITTDLIVCSLAPEAEGPPLDQIVDLGCGTGVAGAAWAMALASAATVDGIDRDSWALAEARWNWAQLQVDARGRRADLAGHLRSWGQRSGRNSLAGAGIVFGWSVNELDRSTRSTLLPLLVDAADRGARVLIVEPIATVATPWWPDWQRALPHARFDEWRFDATLPPALAALSEEAGFRRDALTAKSLFIRSAVP